MGANPLEYYNDQWDGAEFSEDTYHEYSEISVLTWEREGAYGGHGVKQGGDKRMPHSESQEDPGKDREYKSPSGHPR